MSHKHPNITLIERLDPANLASAKEVFARDVVFHYHNPQLPEIEGDYVGLEGVGAFFQKLGEMTKGTFRVHPVSATPVGDHLVLVQAQNTLTLEDQQIAVDVVVVWRIDNGRVTEVWDIPSVPRS